MKKIMTTMLVAAMVLSMAAPATAATPARDLEAASQKAATKATTAYTLKMSNKTLKFYKNGKVVRSEVTKDGKVTLKKSSAGGISVLFTTKEGKTKNITLGKQADITLEGTFVQISADKTLTKAHTIRLKKGSKVTNFYARAAAKYVLSGTIKTLNVTNKNAQVKVEGTVTEAFTVSKSAISGLASSKITVNKTGTAAGRTGTNTSNSSGRDTYYSNGSSSTGGGSSSGVVNPPSNGGNDNKPDPNPNPTPTPDPGEENVIPLTLITEDFGKANEPTVFNSDVTIVTGGKTLTITNCEFKGAVTVVDSLNRAARATAEPGKVIFANSKATNNITLSQPVGIETDEATKVNKIEVAENVFVPEIVVKGDVGAVNLGTGSSASKVTIQGNASTEVSGDGEVGEVTLVAETGKAPSATITAKVTDKISTDGTGPVGTISVGGKTESAQMEINNETKQITISDAVQAEVKVKKDVTVDKVVAVTDGSASGTDTKVVVSGEGTVTKAEAVGDKATVEAGDSTIKVPETEKITLSSITVTAPKKVDYYEGEKLDLSGMSVIGNYSNDTKVVITKGYTVDPAAGTELKTTNNKVTVTYDSKPADFAITVKGAELASLGIIPGEVTLTEAGAEEKLAVKQVWLGTPVASKKTVSWKSENPEVATVSDDGTVTAVKNGTAKISATVNGKTVSVTVTVNEKAEVITAKAVKQGQTTIELKDGVYPVARGEQVSLIFNSSYAKTGAACTVKDNGEEVKSGTVDVDKGDNMFSLFTPDENTTVGNHKLEVTVDGKTMTVTAYVSPVAAVTGITVTPATAKIESKQELTLKANVSVIGEPANTDVTWTLLPAGTDIATLTNNQDGTVTINAAEGKTGEITVQAAVGDKTAKATITVIKDALTALNGGTIADFLKEPLYVADCKLDLTEFNKLTEENKTKVYTALKKADGESYASLEAFATAFNAAVSDAQGQVAQPVITLSKTTAANRETGVTFTVTEVEGVTFYYTLNGTDPTATVSDTNKKYEGEVTLTAPNVDEEAFITVKVIGVKEGSKNSKVASAKVTYAAKGEAQKPAAPAFTAETVTKTTKEAKSVELTLNADAPAGAEYKVYEGDAATVSTTVTATVNSTTKTKLTLSSESELKAGTYNITVTVGGQESEKTAVTVKDPDEAVTGTARAVVGENTIDVTLTKGTFAEAATTGTNWTVESSSTSKAAVQIASATLSADKKTATLALGGEGAEIAADTTYTVTMAQDALAEGFTPPATAIEVTVEAVLTGVTTEIDQDTGKTGGNCTVDKDQKTITFTDTLPVYEARDDEFPPSTTCWVGIQFTPSDNQVTGLEVNGRSITKGDDGLYQSYFNMAGKTEQKLEVRWIKNPATKAISAVETFTIKCTNAENYNEKTPVTVTAKYVENQAKTGEYQIEVSLTNGGFQADKANKPEYWTLSDNTHPTSVTLDNAPGGEGRYANYPQKATLTFSGSAAEGEVTLDITNTAFVPDTKTVQTDGTTPAIRGIKVTNTPAPAMLTATVQVNDEPVASTENKETSEVTGEVKNEENKETIPDSKTETPSEDKTSSDSVETPSEGTTDPSVTDTEKEPNGPKTEKPAEPTPETTTPVEGSDTTANGETTEAEGRPEDKADAKTEPTTPQADK